DQYGGHAAAAGLTLPVENVPAFQQRFEAVVAQNISNELLIPRQQVDLPLSLEEITLKFYRVLKQMAPFGTGNMRPVFMTDQVVAKSYTTIKDKHLKLYIAHPGVPHVFEAIGFGLAHCAPLVQAQQPFRIAYTLEENDYRGEGCLQLNIKDLQQA
ncbi:MAG: single-stranded-DNA-specific exonuclease RecJ, partial [Bacteroidota bacterium]